MKWNRLFTHKTVEINVKMTTTTMSFDDLHKYYRDQVRRATDEQARHDATYDDIEKAYKSALYYEELDQDLIRVHTLPQSEQDPVQLALPLR
jgi:hypothetical protein